VPAKRRLTLHTPTRPRTEPSSSKDQSQSSRPLERSKLVKQEKIAKVLQRNRPFAKPTMPKVDLVHHKIALLLQSAHQPSEVALDLQAVVLELLFTEHND